MFFDSLPERASSICGIDIAANQSLTYGELQERIEARKKDLPSDKALIFLEADNSFRFMVDYLACLQLNHAVFLVPKTNESVLAAQRELYRPSLSLKSTGDIEQHNEGVSDIHPELAVLLSTSGSTGSPKLVKLSYGNLQSNAEAICEYLGLTSADRALCHLSPSYSYGLSILNSHLLCGGSLAITSHTFAEPEFWQDLQGAQATSFAGVPLTFETITNRSFPKADYPHLRYVTQAGGKLSPALVKQMTTSFRAEGVSFFVMYGQTEASPRISYLPPELAEENANTIGKPVPGGRLELLDTDGNLIEAADTPGELVYRGPNVMMGYALDSDDLAKGYELEALRTGDIAIRQSNDLYAIVGRMSRFVKMFGLRISLDDIQSHLKEIEPTCVVTGNDSQIVIATTDAEKLDLHETALSFGLPARSFKILPYDQVPRLANGKPDFAGILEDAMSAQAPEKTLFGGLIAKSLLALGLSTTSASSVTELVKLELDLSEIDETQPLEALEFDSLTYVNIALDLEEMLGEDLPENWMSLPLKELETIHQKRALN